MLAKNYDIYIHNKETQYKQSYIYIVEAKLYSSHQHSPVLTGTHRYSPVLTGSSCRVCVHAMVVGASHSVTLLHLQSK